MKTMLPIFMSSLILTGLVFAQAPSPSTLGSSAVERDFPPGGRITMRLSAGSYTIRSGSDGKIRIQWQTKKPVQLKNVKVDVEVQKTEAVIRTRAPRNSDFQVVVELPARTDLHIRLSAGDLHIRGIEGNKDVECHAGDITVDVGSATDYSRVDASTRAGDIEAPPFGASKGGLFRSFRWQGKGKYGLHVHIGAGSITLLGNRD